MDDKKPTSIPYRRKGHEAFQHNIAHRLEGAVKNVSIHPVRKLKGKKKDLPARLEQEAEAYAEEQRHAWVEE